VPGGLPHGLPSFETLIDGASATLEPADTHKDDAAFWLYSSGSTGTPKGAVHLQHDIICTIEGYARGVLDMAEHDRCLSAAKLFFAYGLANSLSFPLGLGDSASRSSTVSVPRKCFTCFCRTVRVRAAPALPASKCRAMRRRSSAMMESRCRRITSGR